MTESTFVPPRYPNICEWFVWILLQDLRSLKAELVDLLAAIDEQTDEFAILVPFLFLTWLSIDKYVTRIHVFAAIHLVLMLRNMFHSMLSPHICPTRPILTTIALLSHPSHSSNSLVSWYLAAGPFRARSSSTLSDSCASFGRCARSGGQAGAFGSSRQAEKCLWVAHDCRRPSCTPFLLKFSYRPSIAEHRH